MSVELLLQSVVAGLVWALLDSSWTGRALLRCWAFYGVTAVVAAGAYWATGFAIMFPGDASWWESLLRQSPGVPELAESLDPDRYASDILFQARFAQGAALLAAALGARHASWFATAALALLVGGLLYPAFAYLAWGSDSLEGFYDFSGGTVATGFAAAFGIAVHWQGKDKEAFEGVPAHHWRLLVLAGLSLVFPVVVYGISVAVPGDPPAGGMAPASLVLVVTLMCTIATLLAMVLFQKLTGGSMWLALWSLVAAPTAVAAGADVLTPNLAAGLGIVLGGLLGLLLRSLKPASLEVAFGTMLLLASLLGSMVAGFVAETATLGGQLLGTFTFLLGGALSGTLLGFLLHEGWRRR